MRPTASSRLRLISRSRMARGFTLIELMIVVTIIGILAAVAIPAFMRYIRKSKGSEAKIEVQRLYNAAKIYFEEQGEFAASGAMAPATYACAGTSSVKHIPNIALWAASPWVDLGFQLNDRHLYSFIYVGAAASMTAIATGDLDCDGAPGSFSMAATNTAGEFVGQTMTETNPND